MVCHFALEYERTRFICARKSRKANHRGEIRRRMAGGVHAKELARKHAPEAIERLAQIVATGDSHSTVVAAANAILDRVYGKPPQFNTDDATNFRKAVATTMSLLPSQRELS
jgi:hypothetical protein